ncbi:cadherin-12-like isoform X4 [Siniperca chuatsi]|uniref:cadherin-12-like isoform X4 n=1 Tax=Siniperca chuatsi TaxID=119488 RepID=UPI001CE0B5E7|nr:cadherin-12-like isoform X4 [Siniperca chuatsi]
MITREYVTLFLVGSCFLLDYSSQIPLQAKLQSRTKAGVMSARGGTGGKTVKVPLGEVTSLEGRTRLRRHGRLRVQRIKRGWVWNQFFVLEEYMGSEPQYVGKLHTDMDQGDNAVKYTLSGEGAGSIFTIDQITGDIHALVGLDREEKSYYTLKAQAVDIHTGLPLEPESEFIIKVQDINDNKPQFPDGPYSASVPEMSPTGTYVTQVTATDADDPTYGNSACIVYSIINGQPYFSVDPKTGVMRTALANMDREVKGEYQVLLQAKDMGGQLGGLASTTTINITLSDVNDNPPRFAKSIFHLQVPESVSVGSAVGHIQAHDLDAGSNAEVDYAIVPGDEGNMFDVITNGLSHEGVVVLKKTLDYETKKSYTFKVEASNTQLDPRFLHLGPFKDSATVKVNVLDMDEPPVFTKPSYTMDVYEDTPPGTVIGSVTAHDLDASSSAVRYSLEWHTQSDSCFDIDTVEGTISTNEYLDRETAVQHNITVVATKVNNPLLSIKVSVTVNVLDVNEFPPELAIPSDTFVCENSRVGQVIQMVSAVDKDLPPVGQRFFFKSTKELRNRNFTVRDFGSSDLVFRPPEGFRLRRRPTEGFRLRRRPPVTSCLCRRPTEGFRLRCRPPVTSRLCRRPPEGFRLHRQPPMTFCLRRWHSTRPTDSFLKCSRAHVVISFIQSYNTAGIVTRRSGFQRKLQDVYVLPVLVEDSGYPAQSSTATLTIRVCSCEVQGLLLTCSAEAIFLSVGLSTGALMVILLCVALLIVMAALYMGQRGVDRCRQVRSWGARADGPGAGQVQTGAELGTSELIS